VKKGKAVRYGLICHRAIEIEVHLNESQKVTMIIAQCFIGGGEHLK
jgi:hypothetical protein